MTKQQQLHTHRGHCQLCGRVQAIDVKTGLVAKHGYTVERGYFSGQCPGSDVMNLHVARDLADKHIATARREAADHTELANRYEQRTAHPSPVWNGKYRLVFDCVKDTRSRGYTRDGLRVCWLRDQEIFVPWDDATAEYQERGRTSAINELRRRAATCTSYADTLETWANRITGKIDPYLVEDLEPRNWQVGDTVTIGGKKGWSAVIEAIEEKKYETYGFSRGRDTIVCKHARLTRPAKPEKKDKDGYVVRPGYPAAVMWIALRDIKRPDTDLVAALKKAGLL
jgi:hypothetical protein